ncbi:Aste57867_385 [Aphanomyces stellatus]|uniref:Aste57867_385 protein n=1 Tax=Aphanomyces stellatus TaxID=120398 RepID=A0A485K557_9STRA|nr:hypothetical protein As57867_000384 [Aphanomyces stellatus]VFT77610.1 Aste57867_385 [Aphanomyces stellatus]
MWQSYLVGLAMTAAAILAVVALRRFPFPADATIAPEPSVFLLAFRAALVVLYCVSLAGFSGLPTTWVFYTIWNFALQTFYFARAVKYQWCHNDTLPLSREGRSLAILFDVCFSVSFLVSAAFWIFRHDVLPSGPAIVLDWNTCLQHAGNTVFLIVEFSFNGHCVRVSSLGYVVLLPLVYGIVSWIGHETWRKGYWAYAFLDMADPFSPLWYLGVCLAHAAILVGAIQLSKLKWRLRPTKSLLTDVHTPTGYDILTHVGVAFPTRSIFEKYLVLFGVQRDPSDAVVVPEPSVYLIVYRAGLFVLFCVSLFGFTGLPDTLSYYTTWNFALQTIYFAWAIKVQWQRQHIANDVIKITTEDRILSTFFDVVFSVSFLVCLVFWTIVFPSDSTITICWTEVLHHGGNCVLLVIEFALSGRTVRISSLGYTLLLPLIFGVFSWIGHETFQQGFWAYSFLDISNTLSPALYLGVCLIHTVFLFGAIGLSKLKWRFRSPADTVTVDTPDMYIQQI